MVSARETKTICADIEVIWKAIIDPADVIQWSYDVSEILSDPQDYPTAQKTYRWRYRHPFLKLTLYDTPRVIITDKKYYSTGRMLFLDWKETYDLEKRQESVFISVELNINCVIPVIGRLIDRFYLQRMAKIQVRQTLSRLAEFCEKQNSN